MGSVCDVTLTLPVLPSTEINKRICGTIRKVALSQIDKQICGTIRKLALSQIDKRICGTIRKLAQHGN